MFFSHCTEHSKGVFILINNSLEFELKPTKVDKRPFLHPRSKCSGSSFFLLTCMPRTTKANEQSTFFEEIREELDNCCLAEDCDIVIGVDFIVIFDPNLDANGRNLA